MHDLARRLFADGAPHELGIGRFAAEQHLIDVAEDPRLAAHALVEERRGEEQRRDAELLDLTAEVLRSEDVEGGREGIDDVTPEIGRTRNAMHEQESRALPFAQVGDVTGKGSDLSLAPRERRRTDEFGGQRW